VQRDPPPPPDDGEDLDDEQGARADAGKWADRIRKADPRLRSKATPPRWRNPRDLAAEQAAESRAARAAAEAQAAAAEFTKADQEESQDESETP
jgi:hypothetical protein